MSAGFEFARRTRDLLFALAVLLLWLLAHPAHADTQKQPRVILVVCGGLTFEDLLSEATPHLRELAETGAVGVMHCDAAYALPVSTPYTIADGVGEGTGRRADPNSPFGVIDDPIGQIQRAFSSEDQGWIHLQDVERAEAARSSLSPAQYQAFRTAALRRANLCVFFLTEKIRAENLAVDVLFYAHRPPANTLLPTGVWGRLTPVLAFGPHFPPGLLTTATTRTPGLVAFRDMEPTTYLLAPEWYQKWDDRYPREAILESGHLIKSILAYSEGAERFAAVARIDYVAMLNGQAQLRVMVPLGSLCALTVLLSLIVRKRKGATWGRRLTPALLFCLNLPAALLLATLLVPPTLLEYGLRIVAWQAGLTAGCFLLARVLHLSPPVVASLLTTALVAGDIFAGQPLMKDSLLSCGSLYGVRFYGLGNEYLGVLLAMLFTGGFALLDDRNYAPTDRRRWLLTLGWLLLMVLFGWPNLGANAGSLVVMGAGITVGLMTLAGRKPKWWQAVLGMTGGLALAFVFAMLDARLNRDGTISHLGGALQSASGGRGIGYLLEIMTRKVGLNLSLLFTVWFLAAFVVVFGIILMARALIGEALRTALAKRYWTARSLPVMFAVGVAALIFKDTGVVTVTFLVGATCLILFTFAFTEQEMT